jgi:hypothetical protein
MRYVSHRQRIYEDPARAFFKLAENAAGELNVHR